MLLNNIAMFVELPSSYRNSSSSISTFDYAAADVTTCRFIAFFPVLQKWVEEKKMEILSV